MLLDMKIFCRKYFRNSFDLYVKETSSVFSRCNVHLKLAINSVEVILVHFTIFGIVRVFLAFKNLCSILKFRFTPRFVVIKYHFWTVIRYRKILPAAAANQFAEKARIPCQEIPPAHK